MATFDYTAPLLLAKPLAELATSASLTLQFNEPIELGSGTVYITDGETQSYRGRDGLMHTRIVGATDTHAIPVGSNELQVSGNTLLINPASDLLGSTQYRLVFDGSVVRDTAGNAFTGLADSAQFRFSTLPPPDTEAPTFDMYGATLRLVDDSGTEGDDTTNVINPTIEVDLHGTAGLKAGDVIAIRTMEWDESESYNVGAVLGSHVVTAADLGGDGKFQIQIEAGAAASSDDYDLVAALEADVDGNESAAQNWYSGQILYLNIDTQTPYVSNVLANGPLTELVLVFNDSLESWSGIKLVNLTTYAEITIPLGELSYDGEMWEMTVHLPSPLAADTAYRLVTVGQFTDKAGNGITGDLGVYQPPITAAIDNHITLSHDTGTAGDGVTSHAAQTLTGSFSGTLRPWEFIAVFAGDEEEPQVATVSGNTWTHSLTLAEGSNDIHVYVMNSYDWAGGISKELVLDTEALIAGTPQLASPHNGGVTRDTAPMIRAATAGDDHLGSGDAVQLLDQNHNVVAAYTITESDLGAYGLTHDIDLAAGVLAEGSYSFTTRLVDLAGNQGAESSPLSFTLDTTAPLLAGTPAIQGTTVLPNHSSFTIVFTEDIDFSGATFTLSNGSDSHVYSGTELQAAFDTASNTLTIAPQHLLQSGSGYNLGWTGDFTDLAGNAFTGAATLVGFMVQMPA